MTGVMTYAVAALGLNLITGYVGQVSLGHNAFFALGSYAAVLSVIYLGVNDILAVLIAGRCRIRRRRVGGLPRQAVCAASIWL